MRRQLLALLHLLAQWAEALHPAVRSTACAVRSGAPAMAARFAVGVDVGTGSARAGVVDVATGELCGVHKQDIAMFNPLPEHFEQSSDDIWAAVCKCVKAALEDAGATADDVCGVAFDATCSLVLLDGEDRPVGVDPTVPDDTARNVIVWMDHRAEEQVIASRAHRAEPQSHPRASPPPLAHLGRAHQRRRPPAPGQRGRRDLSRDGDPEAALAQGEDAESLCGGGGRGDHGQGARPLRLSRVQGGGQQGPRALPLHNGASRRRLYPNAPHRLPPSLPPR